MRFHHRRVPCTLAALCLLLVSGCSGIDAGGTVAGVPATSRLGEALALVPASDSSAVVMDLATTKQRWGLTAVTSEIDENAPEAVEFRKKLVATGLGSTLMTYNVLFENAGWNGYDVETEIRPTVDGPPVTIYRLRPSLDMQKVIDSFTAGGMTRSGPDDSPFFASESLGDGQFGNIFLSGVTVYPTLHLVVGGPQGSWSPPAADASLAGSDQVKTLTAGLPEVDFAAVSLGAEACVDPLQALGGRATPAVAAKVSAALDAAGTRQPVTASMVSVTSDTEGQIRTGYADAAAAAADLPVREKILSTGNSGATGRPYASLFTARITAQDSTLHYEITEERPASLIQAYQQQDVPWAYC